MNKKIKIIELLNKYSNKEDLPKRIEYMNEIFERNIDNEYMSINNGISLVDCIFYNFSNLNDEVEILDDFNNEEELETIGIDTNGYIHTKNGSWKGRLMDLEFARTINDIINKIEKDK